MLLKIERASPDNLSIGHLHIVPHFSINLRMSHVDFALWFYNRIIKLNANKLSSLF